MIIAHAPAGYVSAKLLFRRFEAQGTAYKAFLFAAMFGAIAPDLDILYFYLLDQRQHHHHTLWPHFPIVWASLLLASLIWFGAARTRKHAALAIIFTLNGLLHMVLDTIVSNIWWLAPFVDKPYVFFTVPPRYNPWWLNFVFHWSFAFELAIVAWAVHLWRRGPATAPQGSAERHP